jgi:hypothetical protein
MFEVFPALTRSLKIEQNCSFKAAELSRCDTQKGCCPGFNGDANLGIAVFVAGKTLRK